MAYRRRKLSKGRLAASIATRSPAFTFPMPKPRKVGSHRNDSKTCVRTSRSTSRAALSRSPLPPLLLLELLGLKLPSFASPNSSMGVRETDLVPHVWANHTALRRIQNDFDGSPLEDHANGFGQLSRTIFRKNFSFDQNSSSLWIHHLQNNTPRSIAVFATPRQDQWPKDICYCAASNCCTVSVTLCFASKVQAFQHVLTDSTSTNKQTNVHKCNVVVASCNWHHSSLPYSATTVCVPLTSWCIEWFLCRFWTV